MLKIKRPLLKGAMSAGITLLVCGLNLFTVNSFMCVCYVAACVACSLALIKLKPRYFCDCAYIIMLSAFGLVVFTFIYTINIKPQTLYNKTVENVLFEASERGEDKGGYGEIKGVATLSGGEKYNTVVYTKDSWPDYSYGDILQFEGSVSFTKSKSLNARSIFIVINQRSDFIHTGSNVSSIKYLPIKACDWVISKVYSMYKEPEVAAVLTGLLTGDKSQVSDQLYKDFAFSGTSHIMAVSGLHVSIIIAMVAILFGKWAGGYMAIPLVIAYAAISGFSPSAMRAIIMAILSIAAVSVHRDYDMGTGFSVAFAALSLSNPYIIHNVSFQLSFGAVLGIITFMPTLTGMINSRTWRMKRFKTPVRWLLSSLAVSFSATIFTLPISMLTFSRVSIISMLTNLLVITPAMVALCGGIASILLKPVFFIGEIIANVLITPLLTGVLWVIDICAALPFATARSNNIFFQLFLVALIISGLYYVSYKKRFKRFLAVTICAGIITTALSAWDSRAMVYVEIENTNTGNPVIFVTARGSNMGVGVPEQGKCFSGNFYQRKALEYGGVLNALVTTNSVEIASVETLKQNTEIGKIYSANSTDLQLEDGFTITYPGYNAHVHKLYDLSTVVELSFKNKTILWSPDSTKGTLKSFLASGEGYDILVLNQSFSYDDEALLSIVNASRAKTVIITGMHYSKEIIEEQDLPGIKVIYTQNTKEITFRLPALKE